MKKDTASQTAQYMALYRAMESQRPAGARAGQVAGAAAGRRRLFTDKYAIHFLSGGLRLAARMARFAIGERLLNAYMQRRIPGALASGLARTKYIDDLVEEALRRGIQQVVILGAGFDTRSLRLEALREVPVIEIDHPDTGRRKKATLEGVLSKLPVHTRYISIDFNRQSLEEVIKPGEWQLPTLFIWEGVTNYLQAEAVDNTFGLMGKFAAGSIILFTYVHARVLEAPETFYGAKRLLGDLERIEERWTFGFWPEELPDYLRGYGFELVEDLGAAEYRSRYLAERKSILKGYEFYRVAMAVRAKDRS